MVETEAAGAFLAFHLAKREEDGERLDIGGAEFLPVTIAILFRDGKDLHFGGDAVFVLAEQVAFMLVVDLLEQRPFLQVELAIVLIFHVVKTQHDLAAVEAVVVEQIGAMNALEEDGIVVFEQSFEELSVRSRANNVGQAMGKTFMSFVAGIVVHFDAILIEDGLWTAAVFKAVQMDLDARVEKGADLMKKVEDPAIIHRIGHIQAHDM